MRFLVDECLSPQLAQMAIDRGHVRSTHVNWLGLAGAPDHALVRKAIDEDYVLVTHNTADFRSLYGRQNLHLGLIGFNVAPGLMSLALQRRLFAYALSLVEEAELVNEALEMTVASDGFAEIARYELP